MSNNLVLYRKYRPKTFKEIVGQEHIVQTLTNALKMGRLAHAYLFCGPRGSGKTSIARLLAKAVNCENRSGQGEPERNGEVRLVRSATQNYEPCNKCPACQEINQGRCLDLIEIDAASNRGIDEIRELRNGIKFSPNRLRYKVFIIDEVHMLTREAFNALLKTLEEPPAHAIFILATTEIHKVPQTIVSRCQRFDFWKLPLDKVISRLANIAQAEKVKIEESALQLIALNADGSLRDGESLLGQIMVTAGQEREVTLSEVQQFLGVTNIQAVQDLINYLSQKQISQSIIHINQIADRGYDLIQFSRSLINYLRKMLILRVDPQLANLVASELTKEQLDVIINQVQNFSEAELMRIIRLFIRAENEIRSSNLPQLPLELAVVEIIGE